MFNILEGDPRITSYRALTPVACSAITRVETVINNARLTRIDPCTPFCLCVLPTFRQPTAVIWQEGPLLWVHAHASPSKTIEHYPTAVASIALQGIKVATTHFASAPYLLVQPYTPA